MRFKDIPQFTRQGNWECTYDLESFVEYIDKLVERDGLQINPDFQRGHVWSEEQQIAWLEFILRGGITGKVIYINDNIDYGGERNNVVLVDGLQRYTAVKRFINNEIKVFGHYFNEYTDNPTMSQDLRINKNNLLTRKEVLQWYLEMNSGGVVHTQEELDRVKILLENEC